VILFGIGFETTAPTAAFAVSSANKLGLSNFFILSFHKLIPPVMKALLNLGEINLHGFICPGHVSTIIGSDAYQFIPRDYGIPCAIAGFEPTDILQAILMLISQQANGKSQVMNQYKRSVREKGNPVARAMTDEIFERSDANWRGIGIVPNSGLKLREHYKRFDAETVFDIPEGITERPSDCICGQILRGIKEPIDCKAFGKRCHPDHPIGPCMVSSEGSCAAVYHYGRK
jgi:hydrogenase expression/formation protein HypD